MRRGLAPSRAQAADAIAGGSRDRRPARRPTSPLASSAPASRSSCQGPPPRFVSRGGEKLDAALDAFGIDVAGRAALDAGASTGGFTDCLLQRGAAQVVAVDVGHGQLHERLRADPRVDRARAHQRPHRSTPDAIGGPVDVVVADLSFISLRTVAPALLACARSGGRPRAAGEAAVRGRAGRRRQGRA